MRIVCADCEQEGRLTLISEIPPLTDFSISHGICGTHLQRLLDAVATLRAEREGATLWFSAGSPGGPAGPRPRESPGRDSVPAHPTPPPGSQPGV